MSLFRPLIGPLSYGIGAAHFDDHAGTNRTSTGGVVTLAVGRTGSGPYVVGDFGLGMKHRDGNIDGSWSAGVGWAIRPLRFASLAVEARYRTEDQLIRGFWRVSPTDRRGIAVLGRLAFGSGGRRVATPADRPAGEPEPPITNEAVSENADEITRRVVKTALDAMGTPYAWGGTSDNGFDCSGLIKYAYGKHGIILPRVSRDQLRLGAAVGRRLEHLLPGDLLGFAVGGDRISHVGLYVGDGKFIHSASGGVRLASLSSQDPDSQWWQRRWISARRIVSNSP